MEDVQAIAQRIVDNVEKVIVGKHEVVQLATIALLCEGHLLIEDVPGTGKTMLAKAIAKSLGCTFRRIQFTPDMLPRAGPVMAQVVLTDEINRATPKTQSALLEAMEERQITVDGVTYAMERPFLVLATQNPIEYEGTFPLPEAQLDRFMMRVSLGYPEERDEITMLDRQQHFHPVTRIDQVVQAEELLQAQQRAKGVYIDNLVKEYVVSLVRATRKHPDVYLGASPRGSIALYRTSQARAAISGRDYVMPDDLKALAMVTLAHRLIISPSARIKNVDPRAVIQEILDSVPVPGARVRPK
jgi:MoxR-like ATPase